jgi:hypothetical protein
VDDAATFGYRGKLMRINSIKYTFGDSTMDKTGLM